MSYRVKSIREEILEAYSNRVCENNSIKRFSELEEKHGVKKIRYKDLPKTDVSGYPIASDRDSDGNLWFYFLGNSHELCVGTTGSGKTTGCVEPRIRALSSKKNKPCMFITDPKGEIFERHAAHLKNQGYKVMLLNFKDVMHSNGWNPFSEIYDLWITQKEEFDRIKVVEIEKLFGGNYKLQSSKKDFDKLSYFWAVDDKAFASNEEALKFMDFWKSDIMSTSADMIEQITIALIPNNIQSKTDPSWGMGAQDILRGFIYAMLEDALDERSGFSRDNMNLMTINDYYNWVREDVIDVSCNRIQPLKYTRKFSHKNMDDVSVGHLKAYFENAPTTARSYLGLFENSMRKWCNPKIYTLCNQNTIDLNNYQEQPFAIFLITRDYEKSDFTVAGMFIDWVYRQMLSKAEKQGGTLSREMYFILDEFGNVPEIKDFENKITTARSRNIWFHMFVQSYSQIEAVYDKDGKRSQIIRDNCNSHCFLGSQNYETKCTFARECGKRSEISLQSRLNPDVYQTQEYQLITINSLENMRAGQMYFRRMGMPLIDAEFIRSYLCEEFSCDNYADPVELEIFTKPYDSEDFKYKFLIGDETMEEFAEKSENAENEKSGDLTDEQADILSDFMRITKFI